MISLKKLINLAFYVLVFFLFALIALYIFSNKALILSPKTVSNGIIAFFGAFFGAFFVFVFTMLSDRLSRIKRRNENHFTALVLIERLLNRIISRLERNIELCRDDIDALQSKKMLVWNLPPIPLSHDLTKDLKNIDFINDCFTFMLEIETLNNDLATIITMYDEVKNLLIDRTISPEIFRLNVDFTINKLSEIIKFMDKYASNAIKLLAISRILLKEEDNKYFLIGALPKKRYGKNLEKHLDKELVILTEEIEASRQKSQEEIKKTLTSGLKT
jgi:hypothetical protein